MPSLAQSTSVALSDAGFTRIDPVSSISMPPLNQGYSPILRGTTAAVANSPVLVTSPSNGLPRTQIASVPPLSDAAFAGDIGSVTSTTVVSGSGRSTSSSGGSSGSSNVSLAATNTAITTPNLSQGISYTSSLQLGLSSVLYQLTVSSAARVRLYQSASAQTADISRSTVTPLPQGSAHGCVADFDLETVQELNFVCAPPPLAINSESPRSPSIYITVTNMAASSVPITVSLFYLPLEA